MDFLTWSCRWSSDHRGPQTAGHPERQRLLSRHLPGSRRWRTGIGRRGPNAARRRGSGRNSAAGSRGKSLWERRTSVMTGMKRKTKKCGWGYAVRRGGAWLTWGIQVNRQAVFGDHLHVLVFRWPAEVSIGWSLTLHRPHLPVLHTWSTPESVTSLIVHFYFEM